MIPLRDENPIRRTPWTTIALIAINVGVFAYQLTMDPAELQSFWMSWAVIPARLAADPLAPEVLVTIFTAMFLHAGWIHLIGNMLYLWIFGNNVEDRFGPFGFGGFYLACGVIATVVQVLTVSGSTIPNLGASGAIAGVLAAYLLLHPRAKVLTLIPILFFVEIAEVPAYLVIGFWFVLQLGNGLASLGGALAGAGGTAWFAHIGGFVAGLVLTAPIALASRRRRPRQGGGWR